MTSTMELTDRRILNIIQTRFPLVERRFLDIADQMDSTEDEVIKRIKDLETQNVVRQISAIFDTRRLGYKTTLAAMRLPDDKLDSGAQVVNRHPGVSHNYARDGQFNLWFTLAVPPYEDLQETIDRMAEEAGAESVRLMPTIKFFKIGVNFDMIKEPRRLRRQVGK